MVEFGSPWQLRGEMRGDFFLFFGVGTQFRADVFGWCFSRSQPNLIQQIGICSRQSFASNNAGTGSIHGIVTIPDSRTRDRNWKKVNFDPSTSPKFSIDLPRLSVNVCASISAFHRKEIREDRSSIHRVTTLFLKVVETPGSR